MRSARDCLILAEAMERRALNCAAPDLRAEMLSMARSWREIALQALWQDRRGANTPNA